MPILKRPPGDEFSFRLFFQLVSQIKQPKDVFYFWSICIDPAYNRISHFVGEQEFYENEIIYRNAIMGNIKNDLIIMGIKDHLTTRMLDGPVMVEWLREMFQYYHDKKFILFTSLENLIIDEPNVRIIPWGGCINNHRQEYLKLEPVLDKNYNSQYNFLTLNRNYRPHRVWLLSLLRDLNLTKHGLLSCMFAKDVPGIEPNILDKYEIYNNHQNDNVNNFNNKLRNYYRDTFVEIVSETSYLEDAFNVTEKTLNSIYGCSFPIFISSAGTVKFLRNMGIDVFDDVVDHAYDDIQDHEERLNTAIRLNADLLTDNQKVKALHKKHIDRFVQNVDFAKNKLYNYYTDRATDMFLKIKDEYKL